MGGVQQGYHYGIVGPFGDPGGGLSRQWASESSRKKNGAG